ncbi:MAG TPA: cytochrome c maturation protein CcmE [Nitrospirae bacterium]|nr:cytochrome c-type biogenesis protein CcmE [bacterium BMS3Abin10]GBE39736.1 cytochrome c-type biogenesis protein CcmE [bacterium BMS3Bbin08]HDH01116.1 cytochrome c maturation protein CcmE [Nitrospirota bacterium]HDH50191.1 cytochrome c maturation protein CcmE [Nitrospirota bacterium]
MKNRQKTVIVALLLIAVSFSYLIFLGMKEGSMYYLEVSEFFDRLDELGQMKIRVNGEIIPGTVTYNPAKLKLNFSLKDQDINDSRQLNVVYKGAPPDLLEQEGATLVAEGSYNRQENLFEATKLLVKCPSKYEKKEDEG